MPSLAAPGDLDTTFGGTGKIRVGLGFGSNRAHAVAAQPDGKIVAAGNNGLYLVADFALVRYNPNGSLDNSFGTGGKTIFEIAFEDNAHALALDNTGRMVVAGSTGDLFTVARGVGDDAPSGTMFDYDGDGKTDLTVYRSSVGDWYIINSGNNSFTGIHFGIPEDKPAPADFDGDGKADLGVFRPSGENWYPLRSTAGFTGLHFGANGDVATPSAFVR